ncbi:hypothetical protein [Cohnella sp. AR92]|uniref:hypothetical protein n=1 Tax=Cohnella sp. AR92 TaxID=648716 RepID=UPI000F8E39E4|nr:hypothetical protein [Cohnella sp. AR92]RUS45303.1 hypothetical protein ELR57_20570 [Cohnella sp. AR92]
MKVHEFYCLSCEQMKEIDPSAAVFKTGFYRTEYPLGYCRECQEKALLPEKRPVLAPIGS